MSMTEQLTEKLIPMVVSAVEVAKVWGPLLLVVLMAIESSVFPLPSELVMIPAGVMCARGEFFPHDTVWPAMTIAVICGTIGANLGAYFNYYLALFVGRPFLYKYGKYVLLKPQYLERTEEVFREYGEISTFVGRLLPGIRHLISIPAGFSRMNHRNFIFFTAVGACIWNIVLVLFGWWMGCQTIGPDQTRMDYETIIRKGIAFFKANTLWVALGLAVVVVIYVVVHRRVMHSKKAETSAPVNPS